MAQINKPSLHFNTVLYTGNGLDNRTVTGVGFKPDWVWIKSRNNADTHVAYDAIRGTTKRLKPSQTNAEDTSSTGLKSFDSDGFTVGTGANENRDTKTIVSWNWKASNATAVSNTDGSITSSVSANTTAGFSIVSYTGTGANATVGHGLGVAPSVVIVKGRSFVNSWRVYHKSLGETKATDLENTSAANTATGNWNDTAPTSSVFSIGTFSATNTNNGTHVAYCFAEKKGYSKFGTYTGQGSGKPFIYTGFKPGFLIIKRTASTDEREIYDSKRAGYNTANYHLNTNDDTVEATLSDRIELYANGFKVTATSSGPLNADGAEYHYMCFAEQPLVGTNNIPATAR